MKRIEQYEQDEIVNLYAEFETETGMFLNYDLKNVI